MCNYDADSVHCTSWQFMLQRGGLSFREPTFATRKSNSSVVCKVASDHSASSVHVMYVRGGFTQFPS